MSFGINHKTNPKKNVEWKEMNRNRANDHERSDHANKLFQQKKKVKSTTKWKSEVKRKK